MIEVWKAVEGFEGLYEVSSLGSVRSVDRLVNGCYGSKQFKNGGVLRPRKTKEGYLHVDLYKDGKNKTVRVHRLVAQAFLPNPDNLPQVNHKDEDKTNNRVENLEWCNCQYNITYGTRTERMANKRKKIVYQYDVNGNFIKKWDSLTQVKIELGFLQGNISACCHGKYKTMYNYIWKYVDTGV